MATSTFPQIICVFVNGPFGTARNLTYGLIYSQDKFVHSWVRNPPQWLQDQIAWNDFHGPKADYYRRRAMTVAATQARYAAAADALKKAYPHISASSIKAMHYCRPNGVDYNRKMKMRSCRKYFICPFCWNRRLVELFTAWEQLSKTYANYWEIQVFLLGDRRTPGDLAKVIKHLLKQSRLDAAFILRRPYFISMNDITYRALIGGFVNTPRIQTAPETILPIYKAQLLEKVVATKKGILINKDYMAYDPEILWKPDLMEVHRGFLTSLRMTYCGNWPSV